MSTNTKFYNIYLNTPIEDGGLIEEYPAFKGRRKCLWWAAFIAKQAGVSEGEARLNLLKKATEVDGLSAVDAKIKINEGFTHQPPNIQPKKKICKDEYTLFPPESPEEKNKPKKIKKLIDLKKIVAETVPLPCSNWQQDIFKYFDLLFEDNDKIRLNVGGPRKTDDEKYQPHPFGGRDFTKKEIVNNINRYGIKSALQFDDQTTSSGVWIGINPLDGNGFKKENVVDHRYVLLEFDTIPLDEQIPILEAMKLPMVCFVHSGGKSIHAITRIDAGSDYDLYRERVIFMFEVLKNNNIEVDQQNKNQNRYSRLPGVCRGQNKQYLLNYESKGYRSFEDWEDWILSTQDGHPPIESVFQLRKDPPKPEEILIENLLRRGDKMTISGPPKSGKSFFALRLAMSLAEGKTFVHWKCSKAKVLFINFELKTASICKRINDLIDKLKLPGEYNNFCLWNYRGHTTSFNEMVDVWCNRLSRRRFDVIIIDPIYKLLDGDEINASVVTKFVSKLDEIYSKTGASVVLVHHNKKPSKYASGGPIDQISGSGVFARDPDVSIVFNKIGVSGDKYQIAFDFRDFPKINPINLKFEDGIHQIDSTKN